MDENRETETNKYVNKLWQNFVCMHIFFLLSREMQQFYRLQLGQRYFFILLFFIRSFATTMYVRCYTVVSQLDPVFEIQHHINKFSRICDCRCQNV